MDLQTKLAILADAARYDASCASGGSTRAGAAGGLGNTTGMGICHSYTPDGRCVSLLKILLTNYCVYDCLFCVNRVSSDVPRARFTPDEVVTLTMDFYRRNYIEGLFLSSAIFVDADTTMEQMVRVARLLREEHRFGGYIHLKIIAGASPALIAEAGRYSDRLSANVELALQSDLDQLAPEKTLAAVAETMESIRSKKEELDDAQQTFAPAGQTTQMIVGATETSDREMLRTTARLYRDYKLRRIYFSAFSPFPRADARLPIGEPQLAREHRLYQADWLVRYYGFDAAELTTEEEPNLDAEHDPKFTWALRNPSFFPVDVNRAPREALLRVPGLGYRNVTRLLRIRRQQRVTLADLAKLRVTLARTKPFIITADYRPVATAALSRAQSPLIQLPLFTPDTSVITGEL